MTIFIKSAEDISKARKAIESKQEVKKFDAFKFCGVLKVNEDPIKIQERLRNEWK